MACWSPPEIEMRSTKVAFFAVIPYAEYEALLSAAKATQELAEIDKTIAAVEAGEETYPLQGRLGFEEQPQFSAKDHRCHAGKKPAGSEGFYPDEYRGTQQCRQE
jgi:hypothetical protein